MLSEETMIGEHLLDLAVEQEEARRERGIDESIADAERGSLRSVSLRIDADSYSVLEQLSGRWAVSKSALAAKILEAALYDLGPEPTLTTPESRAL